MDRLTRLPVELMLRVSESLSVPDAVTLARCSRRLSHALSLENWSRAQSHRYANGNAVLHWAAQRNRVDIVDCLFAYGTPDPSPINSTGQTPLHIALVQGHEDMVKYLLAKRGDTSAGDLFRQVPLKAAAAGGRVAVIRFLLRNGADCNKADHSRKTPLHLAVEAGSEAAVRALIEAGADHSVNGLYHHLDEKGDVLDRDYLEEQTPLMRAARRGHESIVKLLLCAGCEPDSRSGRDHTSLHFAVRGGNLAIVKLLLDAGAHPKAENQEGRSPLHFAVTDGHFEIAECLVEAGAERNRG